jgi:hypothetical protein
MALKLKETIFGIEAEYWRIREVQTNRIINSTTVTIEPFVSAEARALSIFNGLNRPLTFVLEGTEHTTAELYASLKDAELNGVKYFEDAEDC